MTWLRMNHLIHAVVLFFRLFAHAEDPDIDEPFKPPVGHVLGKGTLYMYMTKLNLVNKKSLLEVSCLLSFLTCSR